MTVKEFTHKSTNETIRIDETGRWHSFCAVCGNSLNDSMDGTFTVLSDTATNYGGRDVVIKCKCGTIVLPV